MKKIAKKIMGGLYKHHNSKYSYKLYKKCFTVIDIAKRNYQAIIIHLN
jgi:hypothetical protein